MTCPFDKPLEDANGAVECELSPSFVTAARQKRQIVGCSSDMFKDNCADGYYCVAYGSDPVQGYPNCKLAILQEAQ